MLVRELDAEHGAGEDGDDFTFCFDDLFNCHKCDDCGAAWGGKMSARDESHNG